jgi:diguanylate cyclase (GGDEF)-like protein
LNPSQPDSEKDEPGELREENRRLREQLSRQSREIIRLQAVATIDAVTGIANRRHFDEELNRQIAAYDRFGHAFSLAVIDLDRFKSVNDQWGHVTGDRVLRTFAGLLKQELRATDLCARIGGDEFGVLIAGVNVEDARAIMQRCDTFIRSQLQKAFPEWSAGWSTGCAEMKTGMTSDELFAAADEAMYGAKREKKGEKKVSEAAS